MLFFGHAGITLGAAALAARAVSGRDNGGEEKGLFKALARRADIRVLMVGSLLPDIIDKPLGQIFFRESFSNGRIFAHTLLFLVLISAAGYFLYRRRHADWLLTLAAGTFTHIAMDEMWQVPGTLFWPLLGWHFARYDLTGWAAHLWNALLSSPYIYVSEAIGLGIITWFGIWLISLRKAGAFLRRGKFN